MMISDTCVFEEEEKFLSCKDAFWSFFECLVSEIFYYKYGIDYQPRTVYVLGG